MGRDSAPRQKRLLNKPNLIALAIGLGVSFLLTETFLRTYPLPLINDNIYNTYDPDVGFMPIPNQRPKYYTSCFAIDGIVINSRGFRDKEWTNNDDYKIAILGDSFMLGKEVPDKVPVPQLLEGLLGFQTMNAGLNNFGTVNEYLVFRKYVAPYKPNLVILFFYTPNDVTDNSYNLRKQPRGVTLSPTGQLDAQSGQISVRYPQAPPATNSTPLRAMVKRYSKTLLLFRRLYDYYEAFSVSHPRANGYNRIYMPEKEDYSEAWTITEFYLARLKEEVEKAGGKLIVVPIPDYITTARTWKEELKEYTRKELPKGFDLDRPIVKLRQITEARQIPVLELTPFFIRYRDEFDIKTPYFSYRCDGHLNPLGHFLAANLVVKHLLLNDIVPVKEKTKIGILSKVERNLKLSPVSILSQQGYDQIYNGGRFKGRTDIATWIKDN